MTDPIVEAVLAQLDPFGRRVVDLIYGSRLTQREVATQLHTPQAHVATALREAMAAVSAAVEEASWTQARRRTQPAPHPSAPASGQ